MSVGAELSYRQNMPLVSDPVLVLPAGFQPLVPGSITTTSYTPGQGTPGTLGDTYHGILNGLWTMAKTPFFDTASFQAEPRASSSPSQPTRLARSWITPSSMARSIPWL